MDGVNSCILHTGNILSINDITKNPGQNPTEELAEVVKITLSEYQKNGYTSADAGSVIKRKNDDLVAKMGEHEFADLKIGLKLFLNNDDEAHVIAALSEVFRALEVTSVNNIIVAYKPQDADDDCTVKLKNIWRTLERFVKEEKVQNIGIADIDEGIFRDIWSWASVKPSLIQINLATCCVVPPTLQSFCKENDILLLTHSDPTDILPADMIEKVFKKPMSLVWAARFLVHIKCRGVLTTKGYLLSLVC